VRLRVRVDGVLVLREEVSTVRDVAALAGQLLSALDPASLPVVITITVLE